MFEKHQNPDGTFNGISLLSELSGLPDAEILWIFKRTQELRMVEGKTREEAKAIVKAEAVGRPWEV